LFETASALAAFMAERGLARGDRVAIIAPKNTDAITVLFATLMAGGVYVPIQPRWPAGRIEATLNDCSPRFVFRETDAGPQWIDRKDLSEIAWNEALGRSGRLAPAPGVTPEDPAFILFTSGSTGRPKGVVISHRAAGAFVAWCEAEFGIHQQDRLACPSPLSFDLSTFDIFLMARAGAACVIVPGQIVWMPRFLVRFAAERRITAWYSVPSVLAGMLDEGSFARAECPALRLVLFAGEVLSGPNVARLAAAFPDAACYNLYGPTETNVVTYYRVPREFDSSRPVPIGLPCPYAELALDPASVGAGELLAGGESLMIGYWNRPQETEGAFVRTAPGGSRFYRTGDRASVDAAGCYAFHGRLDRQVKRRGYRIELGEIEEAISRHPDVLETAAIASPDDRSGASITVFVRIRPGAAPSDIEIRTQLAAALPEYMMPDRIVRISQMPRGSRGKVDYIALRNFDASSEG
jgi:amino acid adenylation domain-containing protein